MHINFALNIAMVYEKKKNIQYLTDKYLDLI